MQQFKIVLTYEGIGSTSEDAEAPFFRRVEVDLVRDDVKDFLKQIPDNISEHSQIWISITRDDNETISYVDGIMPICHKNGRINFKRISQISKDYADDLRTQATREAQLSLAEQEKASHICKE